MLVTVFRLIAMALAVGVVLWLCFKPQGRSPVRSAALAFTAVVLLGPVIQAGTCCGLFRWLLPRACANRGTCAPSRSVPPPSSFTASLNPAPLPTRSFSCKTAWRCCLPRALSHSLYSPARANVNWYSGGSFHTESRPTTHQRRHARVSWCSLIPIDRPSQNPEVRFFTVGFTDEHHSSGHLVVFPAR